MNPPYPSEITAFDPPLPLGISCDLPFGLGGGGEGLWILFGTTQYQLVISQSNSLVKMFIIIYLSAINKKLLGFAG